MHSQRLIVAILLQLIVGIFSQSCSVKQSSKVDCGFAGVTQQQCQAKNCCWQPVMDESDAGIPWCFYSTQYTYGYRAANVETSSSGLEADLILVQGSNIYGADITPLHLSVTFETNYRLHAKIFDPNNQRWEVPYVVASSASSSSAAGNLDYEFSYTTYPFGFAVTRVSTGEVLFNTTLNIESPSFNGLIFEDQYLEISTQLPNDNNRNIYGLGEHILPLRLTDNDTYTLWNADHGTPVHQNLYGSHPFYLDLRSQTGNAHGVFLLNSNGMDVVLQENFLTYKVIGGILDFYFFLGPTPDAVITQYTELIGKPYMIPYWVLGFHQCRWGYHNLSEVETVVAKYAAANIPLEAMWTDIDYMDAYEDFTFDPVNFPPAQMAKWVDSLHQNGQHYVLITDPGIHNVQGYAPYELGNEMDVWIKDAQGNPLIGKVWPGSTVFPDFTNPQTFAYWETVIQNFHDVAQFDGLWIDMNEISNFCNGECASAKPKKSSLKFDPNNPPYTINNADKYAALDTDTIAIDAIHNISIEYNVHNLFGLLESAATKQALEKVRGQRAFVMSRSTFPSSGSHTSHWTGDVFSAWSDLYYTIPDILNFNFYGIPLVGADICGFNGDTTEELCARWIELGAFYPFSRNHNSIGQISQELYIWPEVAEISRKVLNARYSIVPYYYSLFYQAHVGLQGTVVRPLFFEFPLDSNTYAIDKQFLVGSGLMVSPVVTQGAVTVDVYFPEGFWYDFWTGELVIKSSGQTISLQAPLDVVQVHVLGGTIIPMQTPGYTLTESRENPYSLLVALDTNGQASGFLYLDDGQDLNTIQNNAFTTINYQAQGGKLTASVTSSGYTPSAALGNVTIWGVTSSPSQVFVNGKSVNFTYSGSLDSLVVSGLALQMTQNFAVTWD